MTSPNYPNEALPWFEHTADNGNREGMLMAGLIHEAGTGIAHDFDKATRWYRLAAERGCVEAQYHLMALGYANGDHIAACARFIYAAERGHKKAAELKDWALQNLSDDERAAAHEMAKHIAAEETFIN